MRRDLFEAIGSVLRGFMLSFVSQPDRAMRDAIDRLDAVADSILTRSGADRAAALDATVEER